MINVPGGCLKPPYSTSHVALSSEIRNTTEQCLQDSLELSIIPVAPVNASCAVDVSPPQLLHLIDLYQHLSACWRCVKWCGARRCGASKSTISCHETIRTTRFEREFLIWGSGEMRAATKLERLHIQHVGGGHAGAHHSRMVALHRLRLRAELQRTIISCLLCSCVGSGFVTR